MTVRKAASRPSAPATGRADYLSLVRKFPLRPIRNEAQYDKAAEVLDSLVLRDDLSADEADYLEVLTLLVEAYDDEHYPLTGTGATPLERLRSLMETSGTTQARLAEVLGSASAASMVLGGGRELSKGQIRKLADHFKIGAGYFL